MSKSMFYLTILFFYVRIHCNQRGKINLNKLADKQKKLFEENLTEEEYKRVEQEFLNLYYKLRRKNENKFYSKLTLEQRKKFTNIF